MTVPEVRRRLEWTTSFQGTLYVDDLEMIESLRPSAEMGGWTAEGPREYGDERIEVGSLSELVASRLDLPEMRTVSFACGNVYDRDGLFLSASSSQESYNRGWRFRVVTNSESQRERFRRTVQGLREVAQRADTRPRLQRLPWWLDFGLYMLAGPLTTIAIYLVLAGVLRAVAAAIAASGEEFDPRGPLTNAIIQATSGVLILVVVFQGVRIYRWTPPLFNLAARRSDGQGTAPSLMQRDTVMMLLSIVISAVVAIALATYALV